MEESTRELFTKGRDLAIQNAYVLMGSAILMKEKANYGLAQSLTLLAYEEASKAVYCSMIATGLASYEDVKPVFEAHQPKIILFDKLFREKFTITMAGNNNRKDIKINVSGQTLVEMIRSSFKNEVTKEHRDKKNAGLYVNIINGVWRTPKDITEDDVQALLNEYQERIAILHVVSEAFLKEDFDKLQYVEGFSGTTYMKTDGSMIATIFFASKTK
jgi:AbiV family abortive infection protein